VVWLRSPQAAQSGSVVHANSILRILSRRPNRLTQGALETLGGLLQLALKSIDLLRYRFKLSFSNHSSFCNLVSRAIRSAHGGPDSHRDSREPALLGHVDPPIESEVILYHTPDKANLLRVINASNA
jgi:hypothetical protein